MEGAGEEITLIGQEDPPGRGGGSDDGDAGKKAVNGKNISFGKQRTPQDKTS